MIDAYVYNTRLHATSHTAVHTTDFSTDFYRQSGFAKTDRNYPFHAVLLAGIAKFLDQDHNYHTLKPLAKFLHKHPMVFTAPVLVAICMIVPVSSRVCSLFVFDIIFAAYSSVSVFKGHLPFS